jgi:hypothetical protein
MQADNILQTIGNTPHIRVNRLFGADARVWIKSERSLTPADPSRTALRWPWWKTLKKVAP